MYVYYGTENGVGYMWQTALNMSEFINPMGPSDCVMMIPPAIGDWG